MQKVAMSQILTVLLQGTAKLGVMARLAKSICSALTAFGGRGDHEQPMPLSAYELHTRFVSDQGAFELAFQNVGLFYDGLKVPSPFSPSPSPFSFLP